MKTSYKLTTLVGTTLVGTIHTIHANDRQLTEVEITLNCGQTVHSKEMPVRLNEVPDSHSHDF